MKSLSATTLTLASNVYRSDLQPAHSSLLCDRKNYNHYYLGSHIVFNFFDTLLLCSKIVYGSPFMFRLAKLYSGLYMPQFSTLLALWDIFVVPFSN